MVRRNEETGLALGAWVAVLLPLVALVFAVTVLAIKAWPAIRVNGWYFLYGKNWTYGRQLRRTVHTDGVAHPQGAQFGAWPIIWAPWPRPSSPSSWRCRSPSARPLP